MNNFKMGTESAVLEQAYALAKERYAALEVDTDKAMATLALIPISLHCWQGDDLTGFEHLKATCSGGIQATGNYPGKARNADELKRDLVKALSLIPGTHRINLHASYAETGGKRVDRAWLEPKHFQGWIDWAKEQGLGMDFNPTCFAHPKADSGFTLSSHDAGIRAFWIDHCRASRAIAAEIGRQLKSPCVCNIWIPDGYKDIPVDRKIHRESLKNALDQILTEKFDRNHILDALEGKLFGIGSESYVVGSHEFYLGYAVAKQTLLTLDAGHFHPTETIADKLSAVLCFLDRILLHVSRGVRWDSDHVAILNDDLKMIAEEIVRGEYLKRVHIGLDFFDASINRLAAWVIGMRGMLKALLIALLEPTDLLREMEQGGDYTSRLALLEELKTLPFGAVWDYVCLNADVPIGDAWLSEVKDYEARVLMLRV